MNYLCHSLILPCAGCNHPAIHTHTHTHTHTNTNTCVGDQGPNRRSTMPMKTIGAGTALITNANLSGLNIKDRQGLVEKKLDTQKHSPPPNTHVHTVHECVHGQCKHCTM